MKHYRHNNGTFLLKIPRFHWVSPRLKVSLTEQNASEYGYEPAANYPEEYGKWLVQSGAFLSELNRNLDKCLTMLVSVEYSEREQQTFANQRIEAERYLADSEALTPTLDGIMASGAYTSKLDLANRIKAKADPLGFGSGYLVGLKNKALKDLAELDINSVTHEDVLSLMPDFRLPE